MSDDGYERRLSDLYRASAQEEPQASIDNVILAAARHETLGSTRFAIRWGVPLSLAAVVVLSVSLVTVMRDVSELSGENMNVDRQRQASPATAEADKPSVAADEFEQLRAPALQKRAKTEQTSAKPAESGRLDRAQAERPSTQGLAKETPASVATPVGAAPTAPASVPAPQPTSTSDAADLVRSEVAKPDAPQSATVQAAAKARVNAHSGSEALSADSRQPKSLAEERSTPGPAIGAVAQKAPRSDDARAEDALSPEQWLRRIERLRKEGKATEARASLVEFRKRFPEYPLPETLK